MSNLADGFSTGEGASEHDVNTNSGFEAALAGITGQQAPEEGTSDGFSISGGLAVTEEPAGQQRDELGRFTAQPDTPPAEQATPPSGGEAAAEEQPDPWDALRTSLIEQYGDEEKALKAAQERESFVGRQANEIGELRQQLAKLEGRFEERTRQEPAAPDYPVVSDQVLEQVEDNIARYGGSTVMADVVENHPHLIDQTLRLWLESGDPEANAYQARYEAFKVLQEFGQQAQPAAATPDPYLEQVRQERMAETAANAVFAHVPAELRDTLRPHISSALDELPQEIAAGLFSAEKRDTYGKFVADIARSKLAEAAASGAADEHQQATDAAKAAARVATGSLRPAAPAGGEGTPQTREEITAAFHKKLMETPTASISEGLREYRS